MRLFAFFIAVIIAAVMTGCASVNLAQKYADQGLYQANPLHSRALNVAVATGLTRCHDGQCSPLHDVPRSKLPASLQTETNLQIGDTLSTVYEIGYGVGQIGGMVSVFTDLGNLTTGLLTIADAFLGPTTRKDPALEPVMIAWMPKSMAKSPEKARNKMMRMVHSALPDETFNNYRIDIDVDHKYHSLAVTFKNGTSCTSTLFCNINPIAFTKPATVTHMPTWLGNQPAYSWFSWPRGQKTNKKNHAIPLGILRRKYGTYTNLPWPPDLNPRVYLLKVSANLPKWVYIYLPPTKADPYPVMLNQGKQLVFVEPL